MAQKQDGITEDETVEFRQHLLSLGISDPVTKSNYRSSGKFHESLAKELCKFLEPAVEVKSSFMKLMSHIDAKIQLNAIEIEDCNINCIIDCNRNAEG